MTEENEHNEQQSNKKGKTASAKKNDTTRHGTEPAPVTSPTQGAHGKDGPEGSGRGVRGVLQDMGKDDVESLEEEAAEKKD